MKTALPESVMTALGEPLARDLSTWLVGELAGRTVDPDEFGRLAGRFDGVEMRLDGVETRLDAVETRLDGVETRLDGVETRLDAVDTRLTAVETRLVVVEEKVSDLRADLRAFRSDMDERLDRMNNEIHARFDRVFLEMAAHNRHLDEKLAAQMRWSVGLLALFGTIVTILLAIGQLQL